MKKKVVCMAVTGLLAVSMLAGCGDSADVSAAGDGAETGNTSAWDGSSDTGGTAGTESEGGPETDSAGDFDKSEFINVVSREDGSGTRGAFIELFGIEEKDAEGNKVDYTTEEAIITNSTDVMLTTVSGDDYAIGYVSLGSLNDSVKAVSIDGSKATVENIKSGAYTIARPFNIATSGEVSGPAQDFINFILSSAGQTVISESGYITVNDGAEAFTSNGASGKIVIAGSSSITPVMEKLKEAYMAVNTEAEIEIQESDSTTGMTAAMDGTCDIGMASRELKDSEIEGGLTGTVIAMDGIAVVINHNNPADDFSKDAVNSIFRGDVTAWEEIAE